MSHVDDGELTAYADGAYPVEDPVALRISAHLSTCANCRTRVEQSRELRDRAAELLRYAAPANVHVPAFETLQAQVQPHRPRVPLTSLAWAATIVLALGIGWFGRGAFQGVPARELIAVEEAAQPTARPQPPAPAPTPLEEGQSGRAPARRAAQSTASPKLEAEADQLRTEVAAEAAALAAGAAAGNRATISAAPPPTAPPPAPLVPRDVLSAAAVDAAASYTAAEAERAGIEYPRIPELPVSNIAVSGGAVIVSQLLSDGRMVQLTAMPAANAFAQAERAAERRAEMQKQVQAPVTVRVADRIITVTGDLSADSLRALAEKIR